MTCVSAPFRGLFFLYLTLCLANCVQGAEPTNPDSALALALGRIDGAPLRLLDALDAAEARSTAIKTAQVQLDAARAIVQRERGVFDPIAFAEWTRTGGDQPSASPFSGAAVLKQDETSVEAGVRMRLPIGTELEATVSTVRQESNSDFSALNPQYTTVSSVRFRQPLLKGFGLAANKDLLAARRRVDAAVAQYDAAVFALRAQVEGLYWDLYAAERDLAVQTLVCDQAVSLLREAELRANAGLVGPNQVANARVFLSEQQLALLDREEALDRTSDQLAALLDMRPQGASRYRPVDAPPRQFHLPERRGLFTAIGLGFGGPGQVTNGILFLPLKPRDEREKSQQQIVGELFPQMISIPGVLAFVISPPSLGGRFNSKPVEYVLQADSYETLNQATQVMMAKASELGYLINLDTNLRLNKPQLDIVIDRKRASELGVSVTDIGTTLETFLGGRVVTQFKRGTKQYDVIVQMKPSSRATPDAISNVYLRGTGGLVQLANVVQLSETVAPKELNHFNRIRSATLSANLTPGVDLGTALSALDEIAATELPSGVTRELDGQSREYRSSSNTLYFMFLLAVVFIYLVLSAQFESFVHPLTILLAVPLAVFGALLSLFLFGQSLNIYSQIGLIMLVGLVTKNSILIVEYANQLRGRGREVVAAVMEAATIRLRPILMTSFATIFGVLPIAIGLGAGAESRRPLGIAVVGGLFFSTFLTLVLVPVLYTLLARFTPSPEDADEAAQAAD